MRSVKKTPDSFSKQSTQSDVVCCVIRGLQDPQTPVVPPAVWEISDGTGNTEREGGRRKGKWCCRTTFSLGWGVKRRTAAAHLLHPCINPVVIAMVSSLLCSISTPLPCGSLCCLRTAGMLIGLTLRKMSAAGLFIECNVHVKWLL